MASRCQQINGELRSTSLNPRVRTGGGQPRSPDVAVERTGLYVLPGPTREPVSPRAGDLGQQGPPLDPPPTACRRRCSRSHPHRQRRFALSHPPAPVSVSGQSTNTGTTLTQRLPRLLRRPPSASSESPAPHRSVRWAHTVERKTREVHPSCFARPNVGRHLQRGDSCRRTTCERSERPV
jgi:hypothetical protein